jgi:opacity protein-like surface antigen
MNEKPMNEKLKILFITIAIFASIISNSFASSGINGGSSTVPAGESPYKSFSENSIGVGLSVGARFNLAEDIFIDSEDKNSKTIDHIFTEIEIFGNQFFSGEIKQNFGGRLNLGYEIKGLRIYGSGGYVASTFDYQEASNTKQSKISSAPFYGIGLGYDLTKTISLRLNSMFYNLDFKPKNSEFKSVEIDVSSVNLGLALNF